VTHKPQDFAPIHERWGPFVKNVQEIVPGLWIADATRGLTGKGKVWYLVLITIHSGTFNSFTEVGSIKPVKYGYRKGKIHAYIWWKNSVIEGWFDDDATAFKFFKVNAELINDIP
jgi:hypothetical protein